MTPKIPSVNSDQSFHNTKDITRIPALHMFYICHICDYCQIMKSLFLYATPDHASMMAVAISVIRI